MFPHNVFVLLLCTKIVVNTLTRYDLHFNSKLMSSVDKGICAYAQMTSLLLTKGLCAYACRTSSPFTKGLRALSEPPYLRHHFFLERKETKRFFRPWPLGTWFKILVSRDGFAAFGCNVLTNGSKEVLCWDIWNDMPSCLVRMSWSFSRCLHVFTVDVTLPLVCTSFLFWWLKKTESSTATDRC